MSSKVLRTISDLEQELTDQLNLLKLDVASYDAGNEISAKSIATRLRVLLHDTELSISLLTQTGKKGGLFHDTAQELDLDNPLPYSGLITVLLQPAGARFMAPLDSLPQGSERQTVFDTWWEGTVFLDKNRKRFRRKDLVLALVNQDGGAHVDPGLDQKYYNLSRQNSLGWNARISEGPWKAVTNPHYAAIRQIGHEVLKSLVSGYTAPVMPSIGESGLQIADIKLEISPSPSPASLNRPTEKIGRNDPCYCGSRKKYKKCHGY
jgi:hypothetical protein